MRRTTHSRRANIGISVGALPVISILVLASILAGVLLYLMIGH